MREIVYIMGKSASGKDNIYTRLVNDSELNLKPVVIYTTRPMRSNETQGVEYHFVDREMMGKLRDSGKVIEFRSYNTVVGEWNYFTVDDGQIDLASGQQYIVIGTLESYMGFVKYFGKEHLMPIYIEVEDGVRLKRAIERESRQNKPMYDEVCRRFLADAADFSKENLEKAEIGEKFSNDGELENCVEAIRGYILAEKCGKND